MEELEVGVAAAASAFTCGLIFWFGTLGVQALVMVVGRRMLVRAKRPTLGWTLALVLGGMVVVPFIGAYAGCAYGAQRGAADVYDAVDPQRAIGWALERGAARAKQELALPGEDAPIAELEQLRQLAIARQRGGTDELTDVVDRAFWWAIERALDRAPARLTWHALIDRARLELERRLRDELPDVGGELRRGSLLVLAIYLAVLALANGLALFAIRRQAAGPPPPKLA